VSFQNGCETKSSRNRGIATNGSGPKGDFWLTAFVGENRSRPQPDGTSVREMDAYDVLDAYPNSLIPLKKVPNPQNIFPDNLRRELLEKWLQRSGFSVLNRVSRPRNRKIPCKIP
jgi:hypothetical protein